jgi:ABC-type nitrate/sulfonate/bicarbonate transport system permease component
MVQAQTMMRTDMLLALMVIAGLVGFLIDKLLLSVGGVLMRWR